MSDSQASPNASRLDDLRSLRVSRDGAVAEVVLAGPGKGNAMGPDFWRECPLAFRALGSDPDVRAIVVRGQNGHFSYGLDLLAMMPKVAPLFSAPGPRERLELLRWIEELQGAFDAIADCPKPVIAAVSGYCIGGGLDLIAACDVRVCSTDARFSLREVKVAMVADLGSLQRLPAIIGEGATRELAFTGKDIDSNRALALGLVSEVLADETAAIESARAIARQIAENSPLVVRGIKEVMNARIRGNEREGLRTVALWNAAFLPSEDVGEAAAAFAMKRKPDFKGR